MSADGYSEHWDTTMLSGFALSVQWSGADANTGVIELQNSVNNETFNCFGSAITLNAASGEQIFEVEKKSPYFRIKYTKNTVTTGNIIIRTYGMPKFRLT
jgi:hypothetical protein